MKILEIIIMVSVSVITAAGAFLAIGFMVSILKDYINERNDKE